MEKLEILNFQKKKTQEQLNPINKELSLIHKEILQKLEQEKLPELTIGNKVYSLEQKQRKLSKKELFSVVESILKANKPLDEKIEAIVKSVRTKINDSKVKNKLLIKGLD